MKPKERLKQFRGKLKRYREEVIKLPQTKFGLLLDVSIYGAIERGDRGIGSETAPKLFAHFLEANESEMTLGLLACLVGTDPEALQQQLESAAWRREPDLPAEATGEMLTSKDPKGKEPTITLYEANLIRTTTANVLINIIGGLKVSDYYRNESEAEKKQIQSYNNALRITIAKINSYIDQHQPPSDKAELDPGISELLKLAEGNKFGRLDYYPRDWAIPEATQEEDDE